MVGVNIYFIQVKTCKDFLIMPVARSLLLGKKEVYINIFIKVSSYKNNIRRSETCMSLD